MMVSGMATSAGRSTLGFPFMLINGTASSGVASSERGASSGNIPCDSYRPYVGLRTRLQRGDSRMIDASRAARISTTTTRIATSAKFPRYCVPGELRVDMIVPLRHAVPGHARDHLALDAAADPSHSAHFPLAQLPIHSNPTNFDPVPRNCSLVKLA